MRLSQALRGRGSQGKERLKMSITVSFTCTFRYHRGAHANTDVTRIQMAVRHSYVPLARFRRYRSIQYGQKVAQLVASTGITVPTGTSEIDEKAPVLPQPRTKPRFASRLCN
jgi:hypothetical protein